MLRCPRGSLTRRKCCCGVMQPAGGGRAFEAWTARASRSRSHSRCSRRFSSYRCLPRRPARQAEGDRGIVHAKRGNLRLCGVTSSAESSEAQSAISNCAQLSPPQPSWLNRAIAAPSCTHFLSTGVADAALAVYRHNTGAGERLALGPENWPLRRRRPSGAPCVEV